MPTIDRVAFTIFGIDIYWYAVIIVCGMIVGISTALLLAKYKKLNTEDLTDMILFILPIAVIGARLYYVITDWDDSWTFAKIFAIRDGGLAIYGGIIAGLITAIVVARIKKMTLIDVIAALDVFAVGVIVGQSIGRWGNFVNQEAYGQLITNPSLQFFPFAVFVRGNWYHATFFYESMWNLVGYILLLALNLKKPKWRGISVCTYFIYYGVGRFWIEGLRSDSLYFLKNVLGETIRISQVVSVILVVVGVVGIIIIKRLDKAHPEYGLLGNAPIPVSEEKSLLSESENVNNKNEKSESSELSAENVAVVEPLEDNEEKSPFNESENINNKNEKSEEEKE